MPPSLPAYRGLHPAVATSTPSPLPLPWDDHTPLSTSRLAPRIHCPHWSEGSFKKPESHPVPALPSPTVLGKHVHTFATWPGPGTFPHSRCVPATWSCLFPTLVQLVLKNWNAPPHSGHGWSLLFVSQPAPQPQMTAGVGSPRGFISDSNPCQKPSGLIISLIPLDHEPWLSSLALNGARLQEPLVSICGGPEETLQREVRLEAPRGKVLLSVRFPATHLQHQGQARARAGPEELVTGGRGQSWLVRWTRAEQAPAFPTASPSTGPVSVTVLITAEPDGRWACLRASLVRSLGNARLVAEGDPVFAGRHQVSTVVVAWEPSGPAVSAQDPRPLPRCWPARRGSRCQVLPPVPWAGKTAEYPEHLRGGQMSPSWPQHGAPP